MVPGQCPFCKEKSKVKLAKKPPKNKRMRDYEIKRALNFWECTFYIWRLFYWLFKAVNKSVNKHKSKTSKIPGKPKRKHKPGAKRIELFRYFIFDFKPLQ